jgi:hypothetical protein
MAITGEQILMAAFKYSGVPYSQRNPQSRSGMDCSGIVQAAMRDLGVSVPRTTSQQLADANRKNQNIGTNLASALQGDVIHYVGHEEIWIGQGKVFSEATTGTVASVRNRTPSPIIGIVRYADGGPGHKVGTYGATTPNGPMSPPPVVDPGLDPGKVSGGLTDVVPGLSEIKSIFSFVKNISDFLDKATEPGFWIRVGIALAGIIAIVVGVLPLIGGKQAVSNAAEVAKGAVSAN